MKEKMIENKLNKAVVKRGGLSLKFVSPGLSGVPDRILLFHGGEMVFCELKAPGKKPRPLQEHRIEQLRTMGFRVYVVDSEEQIGEMMHEIQSS